MAENQEERLAFYVEAVRAAAARIGPTRRHLTDQQAEQIVAAEFSARGINLGAPAAASFGCNLRPAVAVSSPLARQA